MAGPGGIWSQTFGAGDRKGLAIHCALAHSGAWKEMAAAMDEPLSLTAFDMPGHGRSAPWDGQGDFIANVADAAERFVDGPVDLLGHSSGAVAALNLALRMPEQIRTLTLIEPVLFAAAHGFPEWDEHVAEMQPYLRALTAGDRLAATRAFTDVWGAGRPWDELDERARAYLVDRIHLVAAGEPALTDDNGRLLAEGTLETLEMPVMLIVGSDSPSIIGRIAEEIAARLPDVGLAEVPGAGHMLPITHAAQVAGLVDMNLDRD